MTAINKVQCDPFKVQKYYQGVKQRMLESKFRMKGSIKGGKVVTSFPRSKAMQQAAILFVKQNFQAEPYMKEKAERMLRKSGVKYLELPKTLIFRGEDARLDKNDVELHEYTQ